MYSMKEKYRQNTKLKSSTSSYSTRHRYNDDEYSERHSRKTDTKHDRHGSPGMTKQDKYYELLKRDRKEPRYSDDYERRGEKRSSKALDSKYSRDGHHRSRADYRDYDAREYKTKSASTRNREYSTERKNSVFAHLSQTVRKVRENRHNAKAGEEDEKYPNRWNHSGYKELYHGDRGEGDHFPRSRKDGHRNERSRNFSRSRSPVGKSSTRNILAPARCKDEAAPKPKTDERKIVGSGATTAAGGRSEKIASKPVSKTPMKKSLLPSSSARGTKGSTSKRKDKEARDDDDESDIAVIRKLREEREKLLAQSKKPAPTSFSDSHSSDSETAEGRPKPTAKVRPFGKSASGSRSRSRSGSRSDSFTSSSHSSDDEDVLELHPRKRQRTSSKTNSSSSDYDSRSDSSAISCLASNSGRRSAASISSSSSSSFSAGSRNSASKKGKGERQVKVIPAANKLQSRSVVPDASVVTNIIHGRTKSGSKSSKRANKTSEEKASNGKAKGSSKTAKTSTKGLATAKGSAAKSSAAKQTEGKKESESDSESSSESDTEPHMSLSERFAKLTQVTAHDKREFAKPVLSVNEIDTKMRVVRDLRNPDSRVLIDGQQHTSPDDHRRSRPKTPDIVAAEGGRHYTSSDRRRHFERMDRDEPSERPADWNDPHVRYTYYRDRGYFNERPLEFEEYVKWEKWWFEYRDWLASEGYYERAAAAAAVAGQQERRPGGWHYDRTSGHRGRHNLPLFDARERLGRPPGAPRHPVHVPMADGRPPYMDPNAPRNHSRSIGHRQDGSLVINVRQSNLGFGGAEYGYRGRGRGPRPL